MIAPFTALPDPEIVPAMDEHPQSIPPNLAGNEVLCKNVTKYLTHRFWYAAEQQQMKLWSIWRRIDDAWRARTLSEDIPFGAPNDKNINEAAVQTLDGRSAQAQNAALSKQIDALIKIGLQIAWDEGKPMRFQKPSSVYEHPIYNPAQQAVEAGNALLDQNVHDTNLRLEYRKNWGSFVKYGHAWAATDFRMSREIVEDQYTLPPDPMAAQMQLAALMQNKYQGQQPRILDGPMGPVASFQRKIVKEMTTSFRHLNVEDVFIDQLIPCEDMERQPCPFVREHCTEIDLWGNDYHPEDNPFGWLNTELAMAEDGAGHYALSQPDEIPLRDRLKHRFGLSDVYAASAKDTIRQRWTCYPKIGLDPETGEVDEGKGVECRACAGKGRAVIAVEQVQVSMGVAEVEREGDCPECKGTGKKRIPPKRYCVQLFGALRMSTTCLRIQELPKGYPVPLLFAGDVVEDTTAAIPISKTEIALGDNDQLIRAENQFLHAKDLTIYRGWKVKSDSPADQIQNFNKANVRIPFDVDPAEATRVESNTYDETITLLPYLQRKEDSIARIMGATEQLLGMLASGRRSALEIGNAIDAGKNPIIVMNDGYNRQMCGRWAERVIKNVEMWGDRDWIRKQTGKPFFGQMHVFTAVGEEFVKKLSLIQNLRYLAEASATNPVLAPVAVQLWNRLFSSLGIDDLEIPDGGLRKAQGDAIKIVAKILGDGKMLPPSPDDPHEVFVEVFSQAIRSATTDEDDYWGQRSPQNIMLLMHRLEAQQQLLVQQQIAMIQQQMAMGGPGQEQGGPGKEKPLPQKPTDGPGRAFQAMQ